MTNSIDTRDGLIYNKRPVEATLNSLSKAAVRLEISPNSEGCSDAWRKWNSLNVNVAPLASSGISVVNGHYSTLISIYDTLMNTCGPDITESLKQ